MIENEKKEGIPATTLREMAMLMLLKGKTGIVELKDVIFTNDYKHFLVFEYLDTDLRKFLRTYNKPEPKITKLILYQLIYSISKCH